MMLCTECVLRLFSQRLLLLAPQVQSERGDAEMIRRTVQDEEAEVKIKQTETQALKDDAQKDLEEVSMASMMMWVGSGKPYCSPLPHCYGY